MKKWLFTGLVLLSCIGLMAQDIPSPESFLGYAIGQRFTPHHRIVAYFEALAKAAPDRLKLESYGTTNEGRPLLLATLSSRDNMGRLEQIRQNHLQLAGLAPGTGTANGMSVLWMSYNVHGNEASSSEAVMQTAYHLLTAPEAATWLKNTVVILDPCINPDGRDRYVHWFNSVAGDQMNPDPLAREHIEPWPGGRSNHYNFDLNRDWAWQTQVETRQRMVKYLDWMPHIHVDFHEQGYNEPYYFAPAAEPYHEVITPWQRQFQNIIGRNHARYFDEKGWLYFTKERFDLLYPSYGDTWPTYNGSIGMTYEQGGHSRGGLGIINEDGDTLTLRDRAMHHFTTGISTLEMASKHAAELQKQFRQFFADARANGSGVYKNYLIKTKGQEGRIKPLLELLKRNGIEYGYATKFSGRGYNYLNAREEAFTAEPADLLVSTYQPRGAMVRVLFEPAAVISDSATYDITAWSLPYAYGLNAYAVREKIPFVQTEPVAEPAAVSASGTYGYLLRWKSMEDARFLAACLKAGIKARVTERSFTYQGEAFPAGTLLFLRTSNERIAGWEQQLTDLAKATGVRLKPVTTGFMDKGPDFGSPDIKSIHAPRIALITGEGISSLGAGELWHFFDRELRYPATLIALKDIGSMKWSRFDVVVVPDGNAYRNLFDREGALKNWVNQGGKLVVLENAVQQLARSEWGLTLKKQQEDKSGGYELVKRYADQERESLESFNPGSIYKVFMDPSHPLAYGYDSVYHTLKSDDLIYDFMSGGWNTGILKKNSLVSGFSGHKARTRLQDGVLFGELPVGNGTVVFLADDVLFRSFWENGKLMMANALFMVNKGVGYHW